MKTHICLLLFTLVTGCALAQTNELPEWRATLKVVDETGQPVTNAKVWVSYMYTNRIIGLTDTNGIFVASHQDNSFDLAFHSEKAGYYPFWMQYHLGFNYNPSKWNPTQTIILKRIINSIPMYAKFVLKGLPVVNVPVGYDLIAGDWVAPYGKGQNTDIIFTRQLNKTSKHDYQDKMTVSFSNLGDGIQEFQVPYKIMQGSTLRSPHEAPEVGYQSQLTRETSEHPGQPLKSDYDENRNYFFRVRTVLDEHGNVRSALYGKIYGDFTQFRYYLNPTPNSRNIEFNPKQNLLKGLDSREQVDAP